MANDTDSVLLNSFVEFKDKKNNVCLKNDNSAGRFGNYMVYALSV